GAGRSHRMVASTSPRCEPPFISYQLKATVGYQSGPGAATSGVHRPPWTNACAARGGNACRHADWGIGPPRPALSPGNRVPVTTIRPVRCPAPDLGTALART